VAKPGSPSSVTPPKGLQPASACYCAVFSAVTVRRLHLRFLAWFDFCLSFFRQKLLSFLNPLKKETWKKEWRKKKERQNVQTASGLAGSPPWPPIATMAVRSLFVCLFVKLPHCEPSREVDSENAYQWCAVVIPWYTFTWTGPGYWDWPDYSLAQKLRGPLREKNCAKRQENREIAASWAVGVWAPRTWWQEAQLIDWCWSNTRGPETKYKRSKTAFNVASFACTLRSLNLEPLETKLLGLPVQSLSETSPL